ncbi:NAD(P)-dependent oxidoreductase [Nonomuraea sp. NPDC005650]|uniref:NAD(P)-dependent oxidoreductase n=1 Tax=Nonomuraea sp. NPDC005650 TaxID=3157045 RepID=UPI0033B320B5
MSAIDSTHGRPCPPAGRRPIVVVYRPDTVQALAAAGLDCDIVEWRRGEAPPPGHRADVCFGGYNVDASGPAWAQGASWIHLSGVGIDNVPRGLLDGRVVTNSAGVNAVPVAELAVMFLLAAVKDVPRIWGPAAPDATWTDFQLDVLDGHTLGIIGYGHIARELVPRARAFGMTVLVHTLTPRPDGDGVAFVTKEELAASADHIVVAATANESTRDIVDRTFLQRTKPGVHLVNVARGSLVEQEALRPFLDSGHVSRASLDTVEPEPLPADHWLRGHPRVKLTPHVGGVFAHAAMTRRAVERFAANLRRYLAGEELLDIVRGA